MNTWTNEFGDRIMFTGSFLGKRYVERYYSLSINNGYTKIVGSLNIAKGIINKFRGIKCKWTESKE